MIHRQKSSTRAGERMSWNQTVIRLIHHVWPAASRWQMLVATFGLYVALIVMFGIAYYVLFRAQPKRFFIATAIVPWQKRNVSAQTENAMSVFEREIRAMDEVRTALASGAIVNLNATLPSGHKVEIHTYGMQTSFGSFQDRLSLRVSADTGVVLCDVSGPQDEELTTDYLIRWLDETLSVWRSRMEGRTAYLSAVSEDPTRSFNLLDFVYFSGITQTTVGFGDMLPNSTAIRMLVLTQILMGYALLVVILNLILVG